MSKAEKVCFEVFEVGALRSTGEVSVELPLELQACMAEEGVARLAEEEKAVAVVLLA